MKRETLRKALYALALLLIAATWPRDDSGTTAAQCSFIGSAGTPTLCGTTDPLPTGSTGTLSTSDPTGWGKNWFASTGTTTTGSGAALFTGDVTVQHILANPTGTALNVSLSQTGGRAFALIESGAGDACATVNAGLRFGNAFLIGCQADGVNDGMFRSVPGFETWTRLDLPNTTGADVDAIAGQGTTVLIGISPGASGLVCRSTNSGASFATCTDFASIAVPSRQGIASPTASIWLVHDTSGTVSRSTDDGVTFAIVLAGLAGSGGVKCLSATVCLAADGVNIWRSTNAGATWTNVFSGATGTLFRAFVDFGSGVVNAVANTVYRSPDFGATWQFQVSLPSGFSISGVGVSTTSTLNGRGVLTADFGGGNVNTIYSPIVGAGETIIAGQNGNRWDINASGHGGVYQGNAGTAAQAWYSRIVDAGGVNVAAVNASGQLSVAAGVTPGNVTLKSPSSDGPGTFTTVEVTGFATFKQIAVMCDVTSFITATSLDVYIQRRQDSAIPTTRWTDIAHFTQFTATGTRFARLNAQDTPGTADEALQDATLTAATVRQGPWTDGWRVKYVIVGAAASVNFNCMAHRN